MTAREMNARLRDVRTLGDVRALLATKSTVRRRLVILDTHAESYDFFCADCGTMDEAYRETWRRRCKHDTATRVAYSRDDRLEPEVADAASLWILMEFV